MADMTNIRLELCNRIRMEAEHINDTDFPLEVFPQTMQSVILDMARYENYKAEFIATAMLSAVSAALGGTYRIRIKGEWQSNADQHWKKCIHCEASDIMEDHSGGMATCKDCLLYTSPSPRDTR